MGRFVGKAAATAAVTVGMAVATTGAAYAAGSVSSAPATTSNGASLAAVKAKAAAAISVRLRALNAAMSAVNANRFISSTDKTTLLATLNGDLSGLSALGTKIQGDTTVAQATSDYKTIFLGYRVFALALPQVRFAAACDDITDAVLPRLNDAQSKLQALLSGKDSGKDTPAVQAAMSDLAGQISAATSATSGLSAGVLALTPAQYDANHAILSGPKATLVGARADVHKARQDVATVVAAIR
jgi:hypothetical protein